MTKRLEGPLVLVVSALLLRVGLTDLHLRYVKGSMRVWLIAAGAVLLVLGISRLWTRRTAGAAAHGSAPLVSLLLLVPAVVVFAATPPPLGAYFASRQSASAVSLDGSPDELVVGAGGVADITVPNFLRQVILSSGELQGARLRMSGFVTADPSGTADFRLTRFIVACCAADGIPLFVAVRGARAPLPATDEWVEVVGRWSPGDDSAGRNVPVLLAEQVRRIDRPSNPYG